MDFEDFVMQSMASLYIDYFNKEDWLRIIRFFIHNQNKQTILLVFFLKVLQAIEDKIHKCESQFDLFQMLTQEKHLNLARIMELTIDIYDIPKYRLVLANQL
jgi:hypothetical protein